VSISARTTSAPAGAMVGDATAEVARRRGARVAGFALGASVGASAAGAAMAPCAGGLRGARFAPPAPFVPLVPLAPLAPLVPPVLVAPLRLAAVGVPLPPLPRLFVPLIVSLLSTLLSTLFSAVSTDSSHSSRGVVVLVRRLRQQNAGQTQAATVRRAQTGFVCPAYIGGGAPAPDRQHRRADPILGHSPVYHGMNCATQGMAVMSRC